MLKEGSTNEVRRLGILGCLYMTFLLPRRIAQGYAFGKADSERRAITLEDLKEGYALADKFMGK